MRYQLAFSVFMLGMMVCAFHYIDACLDATHRHTVQRVEMDVPPTTTIINFDESEAMVIIASDVSLRSIISKAHE